MRLETIIIAVIIMVTEDMVAEESMMIVVQPAEDGFATLINRPHGRSETIRLEQVEFIKEMAMYK